MARARNIKPGFFKNENLCELPAMDRLLFAGLWCLADREGRLENRPKRIKMELFPCDDYDVACGLSRLENSGFIKTYCVAHFNVIQVLSFLVHQVPHGTEKDSELPDSNGVLTVNQRKINGYISGQASKITVQQLLDNGVLTVKELFLNTLNPESLILNPESLIPIKKKKTKAKSDSSTFVPPLWLDQQLWDDFIDMRKKIKKPATDRAKQLLVNELEKLVMQGYSQQEIISNSIKNCWQDFYAPKNNGSNRGFVC
jgi:hypothetical protein